MNWLVLDGKRQPHAPKDAAFIATALEAYNSELYGKFRLGGAKQPKWQPAAEASDKADSRPKPKPTAGRSRTKPGS